ncbi:dnaJ, partial [Symbiodinium pilosum]
MALACKAIDNVRANGVVVTEDEGCGSSLLAMAGDKHRDQPMHANAEPSAKRRRTDAAETSFDSTKKKQAANQLPGTSGSRAWICLGRLKICTGASEDVAEAINWHILLIRVKQLFNELSARGQPFMSAVRRAVAAALAERDAEGGGTDPRLRFITECSAEGDQV